MHPCSQPRYGLTLVSKPTSVLLFRLMIVLVPSRKNSVRRRGRPSPSGSASMRSTSFTSTCNFSNRLAGLQEAPLPWIGAELCTDSSITGLNFLVRRLLDPGCAILYVHMNMEDVEPILRDACKFARRLARAFSGAKIAWRRPGSGGS